MGHVSCQAQPALRFFLSKNDAQKSIKKILTKKALSVNFMLYGGRCAAPSQNFKKGADTWHILWKSQSYVTETPRSWAQCPHMRSWARSMPPLPPISKGLCALPLCLMTFGVQEPQEGRRMRRHVVCWEVSSSTMPWDNRVSRIRSASLKFP